MLNKYENFAYATLYIYIPRSNLSWVSLEPKHSNSKFKFIQTIVFFNEDGDLFITVDELTEYGMYDMKTLSTSYIGL